MLTYRALKYSLVLCIFMMLACRSFAQIDTACDLITFTDGNSISARLLDTGNVYILYKPCNGPAASEVNTLRSNISSIRYSNNKLEIMNPSILKGEDKKTAPVKNTLTHDSVKYSGKNSDQTGIKGKVFISPGIGFSLIYLLTENATLPSGEASGPIPASVSPAYNLTIDYGVGNRISLGLCGAYQEVTDIPAKDGTTFKGYSENITRTDLGLRALYYIMQKKHIDIYVGLRTGISYWTDIISQVSTYVPPQSQIAPEQYVPLAMNKPYSVNGSIQFLIGFREFFSENFGFHEEVGIGTPYLIEAGLTLRFLTPSKKPVNNK